MTAPRPSYGQRAEAALVAGLIRLLSRFSPTGAARLGKAVAGTLGPLLPVSRVAIRNLRLAMPELDAPARRRIMREAWENLGQTAGELVRLGDLHEIPEGAPGPGYAVIGWEENVAPLLSPGKPIIFFTAHMGNWEVLPPSAYARGVDVGFMYRAASNPLVNQMILRLREANFQRKVTMFPKGASGARAAYGWMRQGGALGLLVDQKLDTGLLVPFFGKPAKTMDALANFALKFRCPVFPVYSERLGPAHLRLIYEPALPLPDSGDKQADAVALTTAMNGRVESWIRRQPGSWLWLHRRWPKGAA
ncbi:lysophospholipid acyltransferase family protein [Acidocella sp.]|uniref:lysophospholipid acyltransferase family protein n=1 Tax=Acidocella sp. TaxID=50710 RepID=UPI00260DF959|nr:lauroyl acyltransferase [Acidocella sp.]